MPLTFGFYAMAGVLKICPYNLEAQSCQVDSPCVGKMMMCDLKEKL